MEVTKKLGIPINALLLTISGLLILTGSLYTYLFVLKGVYGSFSFLDDSSKFPFGSVFMRPADYKIAILYSDNTEKLLPDGSTWLSDNMASWKKVLGQYKFNYTVLHDSDVEKGRHSNYNLLILPGCKSMSDEEVNSIKRFIDKGGSIFSTSGTASFSTDGKWRGWEFFSEVFGLKFVKEIKKEEMSRLLTLRGGFPLTSGIPTGFPLKIATWDFPISMQVLEPRTNQVSYWFSFKKDTVLVKEGLVKSCGSAYGSYGAGRFVWLGFELNSVLGTLEDFVEFDKFVHNSLNWLLYAPIANIQDWPGSYRAAAIITAVVSGQPQNIRNLISQFNAQGIKPIILIDPAVAEADPQLVRECAKAGEIGVVVDIGYLSSASDTSNKLNDYNTQFAKIKAAADQLKAISSTEVTALVPLYGFFDDNTVLAAAQAGFKYLLTDSLSNRSVPKVVIKGNKPILILPKTGRDDFEVVRDLGLAQPEFQVYTYDEDIEKTIFEGGLYTFKTHTEVQGNPENAGVVRNVIDSIKAKKNMWVTNPQDLYNWWTKRNKIEMRIETRSGTRVAVTISNSGKEPVSDFLVSINMQIAVDHIKVSSEIIGTTIPPYTYDRNSRSILMQIKNLQPGESHIYYIDFDKPNS